MIGRREPHWDPSSARWQEVRRCRPPRRCWSLAPTSGDSGHFEATRGRKGRRAPRKPEPVERPNSCVKWPFPEDFAEEQVVGAAGFEPATSCSQGTRAKPGCATPRPLQQILSEPTWMSQRSLSAHLPAKTTTEPLPGLLHAAGPPPAGGSPKASEIRTSTRLWRAATSCSQGTRAKPGCATPRRGRIHNYSAHSSRRQGAVERHSPRPCPCRAASLPASAGSASPWPSPRGDLKAGAGQGCPLH